LARHTSARRKSVAVEHNIRPDNEIWYGAPTSVLAIVGPLVIGAPLIVWVVWKV